MTLSTLAGWNQTAADWNLLLHLHSEGCLAIGCDGEVVATTTLICYGDQLAWLGMVLTHPNYRKRGFAKKLVQSALKIAEAKKIRSVKLDATNQGVPLYESFGFRREQSVERWSGFGLGAAGIHSVAPTGMPDFELDRDAFGANRIHLLEILAVNAPPFVANDGFAMWRPGARASYLGPCVARSAESAKLVITGCLSANDGEWFWDLFPANYSAIKMAEDFGFTVARRLVRMIRGEDIRGSESMIYAGSGFELG
jgi:ribosomal protein S18 acetylase RimI-like enzyme